MKPHLILTPTSDMSTEEWLRYRKRGIGASEVGAVMGLNPYLSSIELFYEKIAEGIIPKVDNIATFMGKQQEPFLAKLWQYWEGDEDSVIKNAMANKVVRKCQRVNYYVNNPKYPWLFVSLDRKANRTADREEGAIELKTIEAWEAEKWENDIPPSYAVQVQTQILVCEFSWGELFTMKNGRHLDCLPFETHTEIQESILRITHAFWRRVEEARRIITQQFEAKRNFNMKEVDRLAGKLQQLEPEPDGSDAYSNFLKEKYKIARGGEFAGTIEQLQTAVLHRREKAAIKDIEENVRLYQQLLQNDMRDQCDVLDFGANGYVSWKVNKSGNRVFLNKTK